MVAPLDSDININTVDEPHTFLIRDNRLLPPADNPQEIEVIKGPNIKDVPVKAPLENNIECNVLIKLGDGISTDDIMPAGSKVLPLRSNIPAISEYVFYNLDSDFAARAKEQGGGIIVGGENYGQGSSREHAALAPMYLGIKAVIAKSFARIHRNNLINYGIIPLVFSDIKNYENMEPSDRLKLGNLITGIKEKDTLVLYNETKNIDIVLKTNLNRRERDLIIAGGLLAYISR